MKKKEFIAGLMELGFTPEEYNSNNGWGFGGWCGTQYTKETLIVNVGRECYRHAPSYRFVEIKVAQKDRTFYDQTPSGYKKIMALVKDEL